MPRRLPGSQFRYGAVGTGVPWRCCAVLRSTRGPPGKFERMHRRATPSSPLGASFGAGRALELFRFSVRFWRTLQRWRYATPPQHAGGSALDPSFSCCSPSGCGRCRPALRTADKKTWRSAPLLHGRTSRPRYGGVLGGARQVPVLALRVLLCAARLACGAVSPSAASCSRIGRMFCWPTSAALYRKVAVTRALASRRRLLGTRAGSPVAWYPAERPVGQDGSP